MTQAEWQEKLKRSAEAIGTYNESFDQHIETMAGLLSLRDLTMAAFKANGAEPTAAYTNKSGAKNVVIDPNLDTILKIDRLILPYFRELGLTPLGVARIKSGHVSKPRSTTLGDIISALEKGEVTPEGEIIERQAEE